MDRKKIVPLLCAVCGVLAGAGMICAAVLGEGFPKPLWVLIGIGSFASAAGNLCDLCSLRSKDKDNK